MKQAIAKGRRSIRLGIHKGLYWSGAAGLYVRLTRAAGAIILMYHSVPSADLAPFIDPANAMECGCFEEQMRFLRDRRNVISMDELAQMVQMGQTAPAGTVAITFDDGYLDNLEVAAPILARYRLPATLYLATNYINAARAQWIDELHCCRNYRTRELPPDMAGISNQLLLASFQEREKILGELRSAVMPRARAPRLTLTWDDVRKLTSEYPNVEIGAHTADHVDLRACSADQVREQLRRCIDDVEREIGRRPRHFSFPYGRSNAEARALVAEAGFSSAVIGEGEALIAGDRDVLALSRVQSPDSMSLLRFWTSGAYPGLPGVVIERL